VTQWRDLRRKTIVSVFHAHDRRRRDDLGEANGPYLRQYADSLLPPEESPTNYSTNMTLGNLRWIPMSGSALRNADRIGAYTAR
jgi:hypothetical protein